MSRATPRASPPNALAYARFEFGRLRTLMREVGASMTDNFTEGVQLTVDNVGGWDPAQATTADGAFLLLVVKRCMRVSKRSKYACV